MMIHASPGSMADSVRRLFGRGTVAGLGESQLLDRFAAEGDQAAFEALLGRHGPMVLGVCRQVLDDPNDVDDAFQATFFLLVKKARSIRNRDDLGPWLHGVARRVATRARVVDRRRRAAERVGGERERDSADRIGGAEGEELRKIIDDELAGLPERYRSPLVLCDLEGETHEHAAERLRCPVGTIKSRLSRGRERLRSRLVRRGVGPTDGRLAPTLALAKITAVPEALIRRTIRDAAAMLADPRGFSAGMSPASSLMQGGISSMSTSPLKLAAIALLAVGLVASGVGAFVLQGAEPPGPVDPAQAPSGPGRPAGAVAPARAEGEGSPVERLALDNGLTVFLRPIRGAKQTALVVLYSVGSDHDPAGRSGLAHLAEHVYLTAATGLEKARTTEEFSRRYPDGANGQTGDRYTVFSTSFPGAKLDEEVADAAARMGDLRVLPSDLDQERPRALEEVENMFANFPPLAAQNNARELIRPTPDGGRHGGTAGSIRALKALDIQRHLGRYYGPRNAIVAIAGDFDPAEARRSIRAHFAKLAPGEKPPAARPPGAPRFGDVKEVVANSPDPDAPPMACLAYLAPAPSSDLYAPFLVLVSRLWAGADKLGGDGMGFPVYFTPMDDGAVVAVSTPARAGETSKQAFARLEAFVAETVGPKLRDGEATATLQELGMFFGTLAIPDEQLALNPYGVAFSLGRREQLGIDPARFKRSLEAVDEPALRKAAAEFFDPVRHASAFVKQ
jgi:zinc protease